MKKFEINWDMIGGFLCCLVALTMVWAFLWVVYP